MDFKRKVMMPVRMSMVFSGAGGVRRTLTETGNWHHLGGSEHLKVFTSFRGGQVDAPPNGTNNGAMCGIDDMSHRSQICLQAWYFSTSNTLI